MSFLTAIQNFRANRKMEQEKNNAAAEVQPKARSAGLPFLSVPFALAFVFTLTALAVPASAEINLSVISDVINAFIDIIDPIVNLVVAIVPLWFIMQILGFIMGLLAAILAMIKFSH